MRFDDRLLTVLSQPGSDRHDVAVRWRQLVDLVARNGANPTGPVIEQALKTIREDGPRVDEALRAAAARTIAALPLPISLLEVFASDRLAVSAPVLAAASLTPEQWEALLAGADEETRQFVETLHPQIRAHKPKPEEVSAPAPSETSEPLAPSLHDVVERIDRRRRTRAAMQERAAAPVSRDSAPNLFRWECGAGGEIDWVEGAPRGPLVGRSIARAPIAAGELLDEQVVRAFSYRAPFRDALLTLGGEAAVSGEWKISGVPAFDPTDGRFVGYRGIALREQSERMQAVQAPGMPADADSVRELVHEIKTPLTAIIGFAEIIEGQYLGPAERPYRERAREIVDQARLLLTAIDDLDFVARIHSAAAGQTARVDVGDLVERMTPALRASIRDGVELETVRPVQQAIAATEPELADRLIFRLCTAVLAQAQAGERLRLAVEPSAEALRVSVSRPASLGRWSENEQPAQAASFDIGFPLRLVRGLARSAGAELVTTPGAFALEFTRF